MPDRATNAKGPLVGLRVIEFASKGPGPYCSMLLSDLGADVLRLDRAVTDAGMRTSQHDPMNRGRRSVGIDLKHSEAAAFALGLIARTDVLIEGMRPGVMERLGLGPDVARARNPQLIYGRMTGWGQNGPNARLPGHDINYIATTGVLAGVGSPEGPPVPPLNLVGDYGGGMMLAFGIMAALFERSRSNAGQVIDAAMIDASASMMTSFFGMMQSGHWSDTHRGNNVLDGGAPFYTCYPTSDGKFVAVGAVEGKFFKELLRRLDLPVSMAANQADRTKWTAMKARIAAVVIEKTRDEWAHIFADAETCLSPVMTLSEAPAEPHNQARGTFVDVGGMVQPATVPRFDRTPGAIQNPAVTEGADTYTALLDWGYDTTEIEALVDKKLLFHSSAQK
ncbi:MAG: CaiB/BaiF CoA-transferase family protein [Rhodospirillales bacterium]